MIGRLIQAGEKRILLPSVCEGRRRSLGPRDVRAALASDKHSLLMTGETGTGKEAFADCVFHLTKRPRSRCLTINCAGMDRDFIGSELFGHKKGAYTGANEARDGVLKACDGGVLFLDEIGWLPEDLQARLLRFMDTGEIRPLGSDQVERHADVRIVAATNRDVSKFMLPDLRFRFDVELKIPSLRERSEDLLWFLCEPGFLGKEEVFTGVTLRAIACIMSHAWPGNVRDLKKYCQERTLFRDSERMEPGHRHILDEDNLVERHILFAWRQFCALTLAELESSGYWGHVDQTTPGFLNTAALLAAILQDTPLFGEDSDLELRTNEIVVPLRTLRAALAGEFPDLTFDFRPLRTVLVRINPNRGWLSCGRGNGLAGALTQIMDNIVELYNGADPYDTLNTNGHGITPRKLASPSPDYLNNLLRLAVPVGRLFRTPEQPAKRELDGVLDLLGVSGRDREICVLCARGLSNKDIGAQLRMGASTVGDHLTELRRHENLRPFLPKKDAGRKPASKSTGAIPS